ncbi:MAG: peptidase [Phycisphaerales bacterium]|nr:peptidase [Phycisphaerales bacterium]
MMGNLIANCKVQIAKCKLRSDSGVGIDRVKSAASDRGFFGRFFNFHFSLFTLHFAIVFPLLCAGCQAPAPAQQFVAQAQRLHDGALASTVAVDTDLNDYFQEIGGRVAKAAIEAAPSKANEAFLNSVRCHLVISDTTNAFTTGGAHVYIYNGLFQACQSEEELAAAIAHAYAHLMSLDLEKSQMKPDPARALPAVAWQFVINRSTLAQEQDADRLAMRLYAQAGWDPNKFAQLFERLEGLTGGNVAPDRVALPLRAAAMRFAAADAPKPARRTFPVADPKTFISLRDRAAQMHEPTAESVPHIFLRAFPNCILSGDTLEQRAAQERLRPPPPPIQKLEPS